MTTPSTAPTREIGYAQISLTSSSGTSSTNWWAFDDETTPELRWPQSVYVYDQMRRTDAQVASVLRAVSLPVRRTPWRIDPAGARSEVVRLVAEDLGLPIVGQDPEPLPRARDRFSWLEHLREALLMLPFGHMYFEQNVRIVEGKARLRKLAPRMPKTIEEIRVARDGGLEWIKQYSTDSVTQPPIPVDRLVAYVLDREAGNWLGSSILRPAYKHWLIKDRLLRVQAQTIERNGMGIPVYEAAETEKSTDAGLGLATSLRAGEAAGAALPFGAKLRLMGVEGQLPDAEPAIRYHDEQIARAVLAHFLNLGTQTGSWALGTTFADFFTLSLQTLAQQVADIATQHVVEDIVDWNWGENEPAPKIVFDEIGSRQAATAEAIKSLIDAGVITPDEILEGAVRQQFGLPAKDPNADPAPAEPPPADDAGPKGVTAHLKGLHDQDKHGNDRGPEAISGDKLKLAGRIQLGAGEKLLSSQRIRSGQWDVLAAEVDGPDGRSVRLGVIDPSDRGKWTAGPNAARADRLAELDRRLGELDEDADEYERLREERDELAGDSGDLNRTASLTPAQAGQLRADIEAGIAKARADIARDERPDSGEFASGFVSGGLDGDVQWRIDDAGSGGEDDWKIWLAIRPRGEGDDWTNEGDDAANFDPTNVKKLLNALGDLSGDQSKSVEARWVQAHRPGGVEHDQGRHGRRFQVPGDPSSGLRPAAGKSSGKAVPGKSTPPAARKNGVQTWEELGRPSGPSPIGQVIGHEGGTYERLPGEPRRYRVINSEGRDISDRIPTGTRRVDGRDVPGNQTAEDARNALWLDADESKRRNADARSRWRKTMEAVPGAYHLDTGEISGFDAAGPEQQKAIQSALRSWKEDLFDTSRGVEPNVNAALRGRMPRTPKTQRDTEALDVALQASRTGRAITVHRGIGDGKHILPPDWETRDLTGTEWTDEAYTATSAKKDFAASYVGNPESRGFGINIKLPRGFPAIALPDAVGGLDAEGEIILPRNMKFKVIKDNGKQGRLGLRWLDVEIVNKGPRGS